MRKNFINRMLFNDDRYRLTFCRQDCALFTLMLILYVYIVCLHFHCLLCVWQSFIKEFYYYSYFFLWMRAPTTNLNEKNVTGKLWGGGALPPVKLLDVRVPCPPQKFRPTINCRRAYKLTDWLTDWMSLLWHLTNCRWNYNACMLAGWWDLL